MSNNIYSQNMGKESKTALLIIDIQNDYFEGGAMPLVDAEAAGEKAGLVLQHFRKEGVPVVHIQHIAPMENAPFFSPNTIGAEINTCVKPIEGEKVIIKHYPNSFRDTELLNYLKSENISKLVIVGMMTHMCVDATTRAAKDFGFDCTVVGDACATRNLEINGEYTTAKDVQNAFLAALEFFYSEVVMAEKLVDK